MSANGETPVDLEGLRRRDPHAVAVWYERHVDDLYAFVCRRIGRDAAPDVVQDTFLAALRGIHRFDPRRGSMGPWLTFIARNAMRTPMRRAGREVALTGEDAAAGTPTAWPDLAAAPLPEDDVDRNGVGELVRRGLATLPDHYRALLVAHHVDGRTLQALAAERGVSESAVKSMLHRARLGLKEALEAAAAATPAGEPDMRRET